MFNRYLGQRTPEKDEDRLLVSLMAAGLPPEVTSGGFGKIIVIHTDDGGVEIFDPTEAGLTSALAATNSGDAVWLPPATIAGDHTIPAGVGVQAYGKKTDLTGTITMSASSFLQSVYIIPTVNQGGAISGLIGPSSGTAYLNDCSVVVTNNGAGDAYAVNQSGAGTLWVWNCHLYANAAGGGDGYGAKQSAGTLYVTDDGRIRGSEAEFSGTVSVFSFDDVVRLKTPGGISKLYTADSTGLTAALAAASSGDQVILPDACSISASVTVGAGIELVGNGLNSIITGTITNNGYVSHFKIIGNLVNNKYAYHIHVECSSGNGIEQTVGSTFLFMCEVNGKTGCSHQFHVTAGRVHFCISGFDAVGIGLYTDGQAQVYDSRFYGTIGMQAEDVNIVHGCHIRGSTGDALYHTTGTGKIAHCTMLAEGAGVDVNLDAGGLTLQDCAFTTITGEANITYDRGDRANYSVEDYHAADIEDAALLRHLPSPVGEDDNDIAYVDNELWVIGDGTGIGIGTGKKIWNDISIIEENVLTVGLDSIAEMESISLLGLTDADTTNPVLDVGAGGTSDANIREIGNILFEPGETNRKYKIFYTGWNVGKTTDEKIHYAYSEDGINWTKSASNPVISGRRAEDPYVIKVDGIYYLYAEDKEAGGEDSIRRWSSKDCETWTDEGQITGLGDAQSPIVWMEGDTWYLLYEQFPSAPQDTMLATSSDGLAWTPDGSNPVFSAGDTTWVTGALAPDDIRKVGQTYYLLYHGYEDVGERFHEGLAKSTNLTAWTDLNSPIESNDHVDTIVTASFLYDIKWSIYYYSDEADGIYRGYAMNPILTISGGVITPLGDYYIIAAQSGIADDLDTINAYKTFQLLVIQADSGDTITVKHGVDNIYLNGATDFELSGDKTLMLFYDGTNWSDIGICVHDSSGSYWEPVTNGDAASPEIVFEDGDIIMEWVS